VSYTERLRRIEQAVALKTPDRTPLVLEYSGFAAEVTGTEMAQFLASPRRSLETMIEAYHLIGSADAINYGSFWPYGLCYDFMAKVRVPGVDLPADAMWQVDETELMTRDDYGRIMERGWPVFFDDFMSQRILNDVPPDRLSAAREPLDVRGRWQQEGLPVLSGGDVTTPFELLCGARSLTEFFLDLIEIPDRVEEAMTAMAPHLAGRVIRRAKQKGYPAVWIGGWRAAPQLISPDMWQRFVWPYFRRIVQEILDSGLIALLHLDSDWSRELSHFKKLPAGRCIMALDGETDIHRAKEVLGDHMCLMGDVPAALLYLGKPDEVYRYCRGLIDSLGDGFILQSGCDIPTNARLENVQAMAAAVEG
jgi:hypothetical protein